MATVTLRNARVGDKLPRSVIDRRRARRQDATAILAPGADRPDAYVARLDQRADDFAAWDGRVEVRGPDGSPTHRLVVVDRYGQVYATHDARDTAGLPDADALEEWFRFLATACPECGVIDDPVLAGPTP
jgi:hypothetical protein